MSEELFWLWLCREFIYLAAALAVISIFWKVWKAVYLLECINAQQSMLISIHKEHLSIAREEFQFLIPPEGLKLHEAIRSSGRSAGFTGDHTSRPARH